MADEAIREARRALQRLQRAVEKTQHEIDGVRGALQHAEGADFPHAEFEAAAGHVAAINAFVDEQAHRLEDKILHTGGLEPGRIRRG